MNTIFASVLPQLVCAALFCVAGGARAAEDRISFSGAVVEPTCAIDTSGLPAQVPVGAAATRHSCGGTANAQGSVYVSRVVDVSGPALAADPLLGYFASYVPAGAAAARVVVQTYD